MSAIQHTNSLLFQTEKLLESLPGNYIIFLVNPPVFSLAAISKKYKFNSFNYNNIDIEGKPAAEVFKTIFSRASSVYIDKLINSLSTALSTKQEVVIEIFDENNFMQKNMQVLHKPVLNDEGDVMYILHELKENNSASEGLRIYELNNDGQKYAYSFSDLFKKAPFALTIFKGPDFICDVANEKALELWNRTMEQVIGKKFFEVFPELESQGFKNILNSVYAGETYVSTEVPIQLYRNKKLEEAYINFVYEPLRNTSGEIQAILGFGVEITDQILARKKIEESEITIRNILSQSTVAFSILRGKDFIISTANDSILEMWGKGKDVVGKSLFEIMPEIIEQGFDKIIEHVYKTGEPYNAYENKVILQRNGIWEDVYFTYVYQPYHEITGEIIGIIIWANDVTEQVKAKLQLKQSEERLRLALDTAMIGTWDYDQKAKTFYISERTIELFGFENNTVSLKEFLQTIHAKHRQIISSAMKKSLSKNYEGHFDVEYSITNLKNKKQIIIRAQGKTFFDEEGKAYQFTGTVYDITESKKVKQYLEASIKERTKELSDKNEELKKQKEFSETILDSSIDIISVFDKNLNYVVVNKKFEKVYKLKEEEVVGRNITNVFPDISATKFYKHLKKAFSGKIELLPNYKSVLSNLEFEVSLIPLLQDETVTAVLAIAHDNTEIVKASRKISEANKLLEEKNKELERSNQELASFSYAASHDLQEPLRKITTFTERISNGKFDESKLDYFKRIVSAVNRMQKLIDALLNFSHVNTVKLLFESTDLNVIVADVIANMKDKIEEKNAIIAVEKLPVIKGNAVQFEQLFFNLINNAIKYSKADVAPEIKIMAEIVNGSNIDNTEINKNTSYNHIIISDNGIGFEPEYSEKIFEIFQRLHGRAEYEGTGIGLAICKKIVSNHQGIITAESNIGIGTRFHIYLPSNL